MVTWVGWYDTRCCFDGAALGRSGGEGQEPIFPSTVSDVLELIILLTS